MRMMRRKRRRRTFKPYFRIFCRISTLIQILKDLHRNDITLMHVHTRLFHLLSPLQEEKEVTNVTLPSSSAVFIISLTLCLIKLDNMFLTQRTKYFRGCLNKLAY